jgi:Zn-dependent M28 family amino/carboxypeptidase
MAPLSARLLMGSSALVALLSAQTADAAVGADSTALRAAVTVQGIRAHQQALQEIADANGGTRASGTPGYDASATYVGEKLEAAGYAVTVQPFEFPFFSENSPATFARTDTPEDYVNGTDFLIMEYSGSDTVEGVLIATNDIVIPPGAEASTSNSGCEAGDFTPAPAGTAVALIQRGTCDFVVKANNAAAAGYDAVVIFNEGQPGRQEVLNGTLGEPVQIPVLGTTFALGEELYAAVQAEPGSVTVQIVTDTTSEIRSTVNIIGETTGGRDDRVVIVGAHLDSVPEGPGINDNGSGSATILEIAEEMVELGIKPRNKVRFAFWGAEESGLRGAEYYVSQLSKRDLKNIALNLNFDMVGSPNYVRFVYDGDGSDTDTAGPNGSATIEDIFLDYFASQNLAAEPTAFDGRSDYGPFIDVGIPAGGLFSGAEEIKTAEQAAIYGGTAGIAYDPCYHQPCDTFDNNNDASLDELGDAAADAVLQFATTTSAVRGTSQASDRAVKRVPAETLVFRGHKLQK